MSKENLFTNAYITAHKDSGLSWQTIDQRHWPLVAETASIAKRRFTEGARRGVFNKQKEFVIVELVNPLLLTKMLDDLRGVNLSPDELIDVIQDLLQPE